MDDNWAFLARAPIGSPTIEQTGSSSHVQVRWDDSVLKSLLDAAVGIAFVGHSGTGSICIDVSSPTVPGDYAPSPARALGKIRSSLSLNMSEAARVLGVERPTVYAWLDERVQPNHSNMRRLMRLAEVAELWDRYHAQPLGDLVRTPAPDGVSLVELLMMDPLPEDMIQARFAAAAERKRTTDDVRVRTARGFATAHGIQADGLLDRREIDRITGRRVSVEE